jgi:DNA-binding MarR family transcriptional regulator
MREQRRSIKSDQQSALTLFIANVTVSDMTSSPKYRLHQSLAYQLSITARLHERRLDEGLKKLGVTRTAWCILLAVENEGLSHPSGIARFVGIDRTSTSRALRQMEAAKLIQRYGGKRDRRTTEVRMTDQGRALIAKGTDSAVANNAHLSSKLTAEQADALFDLLKQLQEGEELSLTSF